MWLYFQTFSPNSSILRQANEKFVSNSTTQMITISFQGTRLCGKKNSISWCIHNYTMKFQGTFAFACVHT